MTSRGTRTRKSPSSWGSRPAARNHNSLKPAPSCESSWRMWSIRMMSEHQSRNRFMSHLPTERLAALVDEAPSAAELAHLAACEDCARERTAFLHLAELSGAEASRIGTPLTRWEQLAPALRQDGLMAVKPAGSVRVRWLQA